MGGSYGMFISIIQDVHVFTLDVFRILNDHIIIQNEVMVV